MAHKRTAAESIQACIKACDEAPRVASETRGIAQEAALRLPHRGFAVALEPGAGR